VILRRVRASLRGAFFQGAIGREIDMFESDIHDSNYESKRIFTRYAR
jgi:hypothetical protein